jgi:hypothetical protein
MGFSAPNANMRSMDNPNHKGNVAEAAVAFHAAKAGFPYSGRSPSTAATTW